MAHVCGMRCWVLRLKCELCCSNLCSVYAKNAIAPASTRAWTSDSIQGPQTITDSTCTLSNREFLYICVFLNHVLLHMPWPSNSFIALGFIYCSFNHIFFDKAFNWMY